ncbi:TetR/AcrR family transcriptional regulator [Paenibacillus sp. M1]|uniref:TetR/AcrR family transcriptional regulator n=1 Tax=Paenibacillus haidiansis TaxID=1574488 RepID=A0ABU7VT81_9BACL
MQTAKKQLNQEGYSKLALRSIAKECGIAVGTIYNYFPSKDMLVAYIMLEDWEIALRTMRQYCESTKNFLEGFSRIYDGIIGFSELYKPVWGEYSFTGNAKYSFAERHRLIRGQIADLVRTLLLRFGQQRGDGMCDFLAESLLTVAVQEDLGFEPLAKVIAKLYDL